MEEVIDSTFSLLSFHHEHGSSSSASEKVLEPIHLLALLDIKATWFNKWMVGKNVETKNPVRTLYKTIELDPCFKLRFL